MATRDFVSVVLRSAAGAFPHRHIPARLALLLSAVGLLVLVAACATQAAPPVTVAKPAAVAPAPPAAAAPEKPAAAAPAPEKPAAAAQPAAKPAAPTGGEARSAQAAAQPAAKPAAPAPQAAAPSGAASSASTVAVEMKDGEAGAWLFVPDKVSVPAGEVTFKVTNRMKEEHDFVVHPAGDITGLVAEKLKGAHGEAVYAKVKGKEIIEDLAPGKTETAKMKLTPGLWVLACYMVSKNPDGTSYLHAYKGQVAYLAVTGPSFQLAATTPANSMAVEMKDGEAGSWLFVPDKMVVPAGDVAFKVTNRMKEEHDFVVHPLADVTGLVAEKLKGAHGEAVYAKVKGKEIIEDLASGKTETATMKLTPGQWVLACYMVSKNPDGTSFMHSDRGQRIVFTVK